MRTSLELISLLGTEGITLCSIPGSARAVYAPRENPFGKRYQIVWRDRFPRGTKKCTEEAKFITLMVIPHEERVALDNMLVEVPRKSFVKKPGNRPEDRRDCAGFEVYPNTSLCQILS